MILQGFQADLIQKAAVSETGIRRDRLAQNLGASFGRVFNQIVKGTVGGSKCI
jgi:hypothetical protein